MLSMHVYSLPSTQILQGPETKNLAYLVMLMVILFAFTILIFIELRTRTLLLERYNAVLSTVQEGVITFNNSGMVEFSNPVALNMFGIDGFTPQTLHIRDLVSPLKQASDPLLIALKKAAHNSSVQSVPLMFDGIRKNGKVFPLSLRISLLPGNSIAYVCTVKDLSDIKNQEVFAQTVFDALPNMLLVKHADSLSVSHVNDAGSRLLGKDKASLVGLSDFDIFEEDAAKRFIADDKALLQHSTKQSITEYDVTIDGERRYFQTKKIIIDDNDGNPQYILSLSEDVTKWREAQHTLKTLNRRMSMAADAAHIGVWEWDMATNELIWDDWMHKIYNVPKNSFTGYFSDWEKTVHPDDLDNVKLRIEQAINEQSGFHATFRVRKSNDKYRHVRADGRIEGNKMFGINVDISEQVEAEEKIKKLANSDTLTGLANRLALSTYMHNELPRLERNDKSCLLLYLDLNRFKPINDEYGHIVGDEVLVEIAQRMQAMCRVYDIAARVGGDEFIVVITELNDAFSIDELIGRLFHKLTQTITTSQGTFSVGVSIGYARYPEEAKTLEELIHLADARMFEKKKDTIT